MEYKAIKKALRLFAVALFLGVSNGAWSAAEQPLDPGDYDHALFLPRIEMTQISLQYEEDDHEFNAKSKNASKFTLYKPDGMAKSFTGKFELEANITPEGILKEGDFTFRSKDPMFGFGKNKWGTVFSGDLTGLGWSAAGDRIEFNTANFSGWACDQGWCTQAQRLWFDRVNGFPNSAWAKDWKDTNTSGTAVIPVPAAAWLLGSGLIGLLGVGKRKKSLVSALPA